MASAKTIRSEANSAVNNRVSLSLIFISNTFFKDETDPRPRMDELDRPVLVYLPSQVIDVHVDEIRPRVEGSLPYVLGDLGTGQHPAGILNHIEQQFKFFWTQL